jgi:hypothetical protein
MRLAIALLVSIAAVTATASPRAPARLFVSGHSLTDNPMPPFLAEVAKSLGQPVLWNRQYMVGSAIKYRVRGRDAETGWAGYSMGWNRDTRDMNVVEEFKQPRTIDGRPYDTLIITEQHGVLDSLVMHDTVRHLRHYHDRFIDGNPQGRTFFYESWLGLPDKSDARRWIDYERAASPVWQCVVTRINRALETAGRADRLASLPAGLALAELVERATQPPGLAGLTAATVPQTLNRVFADNVHLTRLGSYYVALVSYAVVFDRPPVGAWFPDGVSAEQAMSLQRVAWDAISRYKAGHRPWPLERCSQALSEPFKTLYFDHMRDTYWAAQGESFSTALKRLRHNLRWHWQLWRDHDGDAFHTRTEDWFPPP